MNYVIVYNRNVWAIPEIFVRGPGNLKDTWNFLLLLIANDIIMSMKCLMNNVKIKVKWKQQQHTNTQQYILKFRQTNFTYSKSMKFFIIFTRGNTKLYMMWPKIISMHELQFMYNVDESCNINTLLFLYTFYFNPNYLIIQR